jgi:hypothetical protein
MNECFSVIKYMADHQNAETRRQVKKLRQAHGPGTVQGSWFSQGARRIAGQASQLLAKVGQTPEAFSRGQRRDAGQA